MFSIGRRTIMAHRYFYEVLKAVIPVGHEIDHLCRITSCVNPSHLEAVTHAENMRRTPRVTSSECKYGHALDGVRTRKDGGRYCKVCNLQNKRRQRSGKQ